MSKIDLASQKTSTCQNICESDDIGLIYGTFYIMANFHLTRLPVIWIYLRNVNIDFQNFCLKLTDNYMSLQRRKKFYPIYYGYGVMRKTVIFGVSLRWAKFGFCKITPKPLCRLQWLTHRLKGLKILHLTYIKQFRSVKRLSSYRAKHDFLSILAEKIWNAYLGMKE